MHLLLEKLPFHHVLYYEMVNIPSPGSMSWFVKKCIRTEIVYSLLFELEHSLIDMTLHYSYKFLPKLIC